MLKIRNYLKACTENLVEIEKCCERKSLLAEIGADIAENGRRKGKKRGPLEGPDGVFGVSRLAVCESILSTSRLASIHIENIKMVVDVGRMFAEEKDSNVARSAPHCCPPRAKRASIRGRIPRPELIQSI